MTFFTSDGLAARLLLRIDTGEGANIRRLRPSNRARERPSTVSPPSRGHRTGSCPTGIGVEFYAAAKRSNGVRRRRSAPPARPMPAIIIAQLAGSGTAPASGVTEKLSPATSKTVKP